MPGLIDFKFNEFLGGMAVTFFFVLSGFLITSLLLTERAARGTIGVGRFLTNRALRIWPLYYLVVVSGYIISFLFWDIPLNPFENGLILSVLLLPNVAFAFDLLPAILIHIWSIGTEEQFYLVWPFLLKHLVERKLIRLFLAIILFWLVARGIVHLLGDDYRWLNILLFRTRIDCMAIGGLSALLLFFQEGALRQWTKLYQLVVHPVTGWSVAAGFILLLLVSYRYRVSLYQLYSLVFAILIIRVIIRPVRWLESGIPRYLGKISFGIYMLQNFVIFFLFRTWIEKQPGVLSGRPAGVGIFALSALLTIGLAALSYTFFESWFLKRKV